MDTLSEMAGLIARHAPVDGIHATPVDRLTLIRSSGPSLPSPGIYQPSLCLVASGAKRVTLGDRIYCYDASRYLIVTVDLPVLGHVIEATPDAPYLCVRLDLDLVTLGQLMIECGVSAPPPGFAPGLVVHDADPALLDAAVRLLRLLDRPGDIGVLAPLAEREILYRLLTGEEGLVLRHIATMQSRLAQVSRAITWIKRHFRTPFSVEAVAREAGMSPSALHAHFKAVTAMSPLQYQKQMRLQEARRLMLGQALDAASAGFEVGYESPSQFSREYRRLFGLPPSRDIVRLRAHPELMPA
ncbi:AraC family transcriptional regulator [Sphingosinicella sp. LHD-64]|uniref:AraC family transcriptional regulator n=1 Tax=Sphingosinicella sp. LHD-64 TaxID=3072139 RepID=UPI00280C7DD5|nr:AraC family transcriptional regulator [Sphingosinicella sp. LHD-64]MDQ8758346.1 AraC family transcriptional regulator [Sphingosinicella sp. LHD-64]